MQLKNLFISLSNSLLILLWVVVWLIVFELAILLIPYQPPLEKPNSAQRYLEYGRSVEGKLRNMIGSTDETTVPVTLAGWLDPERERWDSIPNKPDTPNGQLIAIYGMSYAQHLGLALEKKAADTTVRFLGGPGAPPNHAYTTYLLDRGRHQAQTVLLGVTASGLVGMTTFTSLNKTFEYPLPYTYPKYHVKEGQLAAFWPSVRTIDDLRQVLQYEDRWQDYVAELAAEDSYYHPFLFHENIFDHAAILRFVRRAWAKRHARSIREDLYSPYRGFNEHSEVILSLRLIIQAFAKQAKADGQLPIVLVFNTIGYRDHLYRALAKTFEEQNILAMNSQLFAPADDPKNIAPDGHHFSKAANLRFAEAIINMIKTHSSP